MTGAHARVGVLLGVKAHLLAFASCPSSSSEPSAGSKDTLAPLLLTGVSWASALQAVRLLRMSWPTPSSGTGLPALSAAGCCTDVPTQKVACQATWRPCKGAALGAYRCKRDVANEGHHWHVHVVDACIRVSQPHAKQVSSSLPHTNSNSIQPADAGPIVGATNAAIDTSILLPLRPTGC
jgi:hypothetical protein